MTEQFEVKIPWGDVDATPVRGISPRVADLEGKTIGLYASYKVAAPGILSVVESELKQRVPSAQFSWFSGKDFVESALTLADQQRLEAWLDTVDTVVAAVGD